MPNTRWLTDEEQEAWRAFLWTSHLLHEALDRQLQRDAGMPHAYYMILAMLSESSERSMTMTELARTVRYSASRLSHAVSKLEDRGWVRRAKHPEDGRTTVAELTDQGYAALADAAPGHVNEVWRNLFEPLKPTQVRQLHGICRAALDVLAAEAGCTPTDDPRSDVRPARPHRS